MIVGVEESILRALDEFIKPPEEDEAGGFKGQGPHLALCLNWLHLTHGAGLDCPENLFMQ